MDGSTNMGMGALWFLGGLIATAATSGTGGFVLFWGAMLYGAIRFLIGLTQAVTN